MPNARKLIVALVSSVLLIASSVSLLAGWTIAAGGLLIVGVAAAVMSELAVRGRAKNTQLPVFPPELAVDVRSERESAGEVAAVKALRAHYPDLSLVDAVTLVRGL